MRLRVPNVKVVRDERTGAELSYVGGSSNRDMLGTVYRLTVPRGDRLLFVEVIAGDITSIPADKFAKSSGIDMNRMSMTEHLKFVEEYADKYGAMFDVSKFEVEEANGEDVLVFLRNQLLHLFFELNSALRYNRPGSRYLEGYLPDKVQFYPYNVSRDICGLFSREDI